MGTRIHPKVVIIKTFIIHTKLDNQDEQKEGQNM